MLLDQLTRGKLPPWDFNDDRCVFFVIEKGFEGHMLSFALFPCVRQEVRTSTSERLVVDWLVSEVLLLLTD